MKQLTLTFSLFSLLLVLVFSGCKKENLELKTIDPTNDPSALSRALLIENAINRKGIAPNTENFSNLLITNSQRTALISSDNFLFVPFIYNSSSDIQGVYLQVEGADNYWELSFDPEDVGQSAVKVLSVGIPENVIGGDFNLDYRLFGEAGETGNTVVLKTTVELPENYCEDGKPFPKVEGNDGLVAKSYTFGETPGFISIEFDTYSIPDRVDVRYNNQWIRSTGALISGNTPPIKECSNVAPGDGFLGQHGVFNIFYDPSISRKVDVYVSGCLDGGTAWEFEVKECPKDKPVMGVHSNLPPESPDPKDGHAWVSITLNGKTTNYGLWPDGHHRTVDNGPGSDIRVGLETGIGTVSRYYPLEENQVTQFEAIMTQNKSWSYTYNCSSFAQEVVKSVTGEYIDADEIIIGSPIETPRKLSDGINKLEANNPTSTFAPTDMGTDSSSCSFCF